MDRANNKYDRQNKRYAPYRPKNSDSRNEQRSFSTTRFNGRGTDRGRPNNRNFNNNFRFEGARDDFITRTEGNRNNFRLDRDRNNFEFRPRSITIDTEVYNDLILKAKMPNPIKNSNVTRKSNEEIAKKDENKEKKKKPKDAEKTSKKENHKKEEKNIAIPNDEASMNDRRACFLFIGEYETVGAFKNENYDFLLETFKRTFRGWIVKAHIVEVNMQDKMNPKIIEKLKQIRKANDNNCLSIVYIGCNQSIATFNQIIEKCRQALKPKIELGVIPWSTRSRTKMGETPYLRLTEIRGDYAELYFKKSITIYDLDPPYKNLFEGEKEHLKDWFKFVTKFAKKIAPTAKSYKHQQTTKRLKYKISGLSTEDTTSTDERGDDDDDKMEDECANWLEYYIYKNKASRRIRI